MGRYYKTKDGKKVPSVTTVLKLKDKGEGLMQWAVNCGVNHVKEACKQQGIVTLDDIEKIEKEAKRAWKSQGQEAAGVGTKVHNALEKFVMTGRLPPMEGDWRFKNGLQAGIDFLEDYKVKVLEVEIECVTDEYGGRCDLIGEFADDVWMLDWKTSNSIYDEYAYQTAAYRRTRPECTRNGVIRLDKLTGKYEFKDFSETYERDLAVFDHLCGIWHLTKNFRGCKAAPTQEDE
jgi:hypothetical protein